MENKLNCYYCNVIHTENKECIYYCENCNVIHSLTEDCINYCKHCDTNHEDCDEYLKLKEQLQEKELIISKLKPYADVGKAYIKKKDCDCDEDICMCIKSRFEL